MKEVYSIGKELENNPALMELFKIARKLDKEDCARYSAGYWSCG